MSNVTKVFAVCVIDWTQEVIKNKRKLLNNNDNNNSNDNDDDNDSNNNNNNNNLISRRYEWIIFRWIKEQFSSDYHVVCNGKTNRPSLRVLWKYAA